LSLPCAGSPWGAGPHRVNADPHTGSQRYEGLACLSTRLAWGPPTPYPSCGQGYQTVRGAQPAAGGYAGGHSGTGSPAAAPPAGMLCAGVWPVLALPAGQLSASPSRLGTSGAWKPAA